MLVPHFATLYLVATLYLGYGPPGSDLDVQVPMLPGTIISFDSLLRCPTKCGFTYWNFADQPTPFHKSTVQLACLHATSITQFDPILNELINHSRDWGGDRLLTVIWRQ